MKVGYDTYNSPIGTIGIVVNEIGVCKVELFEKIWESYIEENNHIIRDKDLCKQAITQLEEYFQGVRKEFTVPLDIKGTEFKRNVWTSLKNIPYGETRCYSDIAKDIGNMKAVRAVGQANKSNLLPIFIPCHRVIGKSGKLVGFGGNNIHIQKYLLNIEGINLT